MSALLAAGLGAGVGLGVVLVAAALRGRPLLAESALRDRIERLASGRSVGRATVAVGVGLAAAAVTGWVALGLLGAAAVVFGPGLLRSAATRRGAIGRTEAIAAWTELVRDSIAGAAGLEEAIAATADVAPPAIAPDVRLLVDRLQHQGLAQALAAFGDDLDHASADFVVVSLSVAAQMEASGLSDLLSRLAHTVREEAGMRARVEVGRAKIRTATAIILGVVVLALAMVWATSRGYLDRYDEPAGQVVLLVVFGVFGLAGWLLARMSALEVPERFRARSRWEVAR